MAAARRGVPGRIGAALTIVALLAPRPLHAATASGGDDDLSDVLPPVAEKRQPRLLDVPVVETRPFSFGATARAARGLYQIVAQGAFFDELARGRIAVRADASAGLGTTSLSDLRDAGPVFDGTARMTVRELPFEETTAALTASASRQIQAGLTFEREGETFAVGAVPRSFLRLGAGYSVELSRVAGRAAAGIPGVRLAGVLSVLEQAVSLDLTDPLAPDGGVKLRLDLAEAGGPLGGDFSFVRASPQAIVLAPLSERVTLASRLRLGLLLGAAPVYERFFAGGAESVRSYGYNQLSPYARATTGEAVPVGGAGLLLASLELRASLPPIPHVPVPLIAAVFVDAGRVSVSAADLLSQPPSLAAGAGLRAATPLGVLRLDVGISLFRPPLPTVGPGVTPPHLAPWALHLAAGEAF